MDGPTPQSLQPGLQGLLADANHVKARVEERIYALNAGIEDLMIQIRDKLGHLSRTEELSVETLERMVRHKVERLYEVRAELQRQIESFPNPERAGTNQAIPEKVVFEMYSLVNVTHRILDGWF